MSATIAMSSSSEIYVFEECIREVEHAPFTPLVFTTSGGASPLTTTFLKHLGSKPSEKRDMAYSSCHLAMGPAQFQPLWSAMISGGSHWQWVMHTMTTHLLLLLQSPDSFLTKNSYPTHYHIETTTHYLSLFTTLDITSLMYSYTKFTLGPTSTFMHIINMLSM